MDDEKIIQFQLTTGSDVSNTKAALFVLTDSGRMFFLTVERSMGEWEEIKNLPPLHKV